MLAPAACTTTSAEGRVNEVLDQAAFSKRTGFLEEARQRYASVLETDPQNVVALRGLVEVHHRLGRLPELESRFKARIAAQPTDAAAHEGLGLVYYALGATEGPKAKEELAKAAELAPKVADYHYRLGIVLTEGDEYAEARAVLAKAVELDPKRARYRLPYATALARTGARKEGVAQLAAILSLDPAREEVQLAERAAKQLVDPFRGFPQSAREQYDLALNYLQSDSTAQAQTALDALLERYPDLAILHATSGLAAMKTGDAGRAIAEFRRASELDPELADPHEYLADLYFNRGRPDTAREHYEAALARNPYLPGPRKRLAEVALKDNRKEAAAEEYGRYLLLRPDDFDVLVAHATLLTDLGRPDAGEAWDELIHRYPRRPDALVGAAKFFFVRAATAKTPEERSAAKDRTRNVLEAAVEVDPENLVAAEMLAQLKRLP